MSASCIYEGTIRHRRFDPRREFSHRLALAYLDLDELPGLLDGRLVARRPGLVRFRRRDYLGDPAVPLHRAVRDVVEDQTGARPEGPIRLLAQLRSFGHCFNPVSFYYCFEPGGERVQALVAEVTNTPWGERHAYVIEGEQRDSAVLAGEFDKALHVSPFMGMDHRYDARAAAPAQTLSVHISSSRAGVIRVRRDAGAAPPGADACVDRGDHRAVPARDGPGAGADLCACAGAEARGRARPPPSAGGTGMSTSLARWLVSILLRRITVGSLLVVEGDERRVYGSGAPAATVWIDSPRTWPKLLRGSRGMAEAFAQGLWDSPDLVALIRLAARNAGGLDRLRSWLAPVRWPLQRAGALLRRSTKRRRRRDIAAHYDLGNELFSRMLDPTMSYSCALFEQEGMTLEQAQVAKLERICEQLDLGPGDRVLEIGTGWGAFALHAAATRGCHVTTTTISREQHDYAVEQVHSAGLSDRVTVLMEDYRDLRGRYDKLVSIEMIEAVGWRHFGTFFAKCSELLAPDGAMLLQAITIDDRAYEVEKASKSFINSYIFPGGCLPSLEVIARNVARRTDLQAVGLEDLTPHYVETLRRWRRTFTAHAPELAEWATTSASAGSGRSTLPTARPASRSGGSATSSCC